jgi:hypothetical protein
MVFTIAIKTIGESSPILSSMLFVAFIFALGIAPQFSSDPFLKLLPIMIIPVIAVASSPSTGFMMNTELLMFSGLITAGYIKLLTLNDTAEEALKRPKERKLTASLLYVTTFFIFFGTFVGVSKMSGGRIETHKDPSSMSPFYWLLMFLYVVVALASVTGFQLGFGGKSKSKKEEEPEEETEEEPEEEAEA